MSFLIKTTALLTAAAVGVCASAAMAQDASPSYYLGAGVGLVDVPDTNVTDTAKRKVKFDNGNMGSLFLGYDYASPWRGEVELSRRAAGLKSVAGTAASGEWLATSLMANAIYDFDINAPVTPYLGLGAGFSRVEFDNASPFGASSINDTDTAMALQGIAGVSYAVADNLNLFADYRYFTARDVDMRTVAGTSASFDANTHSVMVGLRFDFGAPKAQPRPQPQPTPVAAPAPAPEPAPAPQPVAAQTPDLPRNYIVFFDWDKADITPEAAAIIQAAASNADDMNVVRLNLTGHADRSGPQGYNLKLSKKRGDAVREAFAALGFQPGEISVVAKGETDPLVATDDGVREPQNRRVEIVLP
ncbi:OmpA family protein [Pseudomonadota bacterium]